MPAEPMAYQPYLPGRATQVFQLNWELTKPLETVHTVDLQEVRRHLEASAPASPREL